MTSYDLATGGETGRRPTAAELFAGVGGFHLALDRAGFDVVWSNQWEPATKTQHAFDSYELHVKAGDFQRHGRVMRGTEHPGDLGLVEHVASNEDIALVLDRYEAQVSGQKQPVFPVVPDVDLLVGGFPCQDYSVARTLRQAHGIIGKKGVLWWEIHRLLRLKLEAGRPIKNLFLENVDRLLKSPSGQRGRDFAVMLASLADLGYEVEWRVVNAADYGYPQKRRRVFIIGRLGRQEGDPRDQLLQSGVLARALPSRLRGASFDWSPLPLDGDIKVVSDTFGLGGRRTPFGNAGVMRISDGRRGAAVYTQDVESTYAGRRLTLGDILEADADVPEQFFVASDDLGRWKFLKGAKSLSRISRSTGLEYTYDEGSIPFPDPIERPSRTILTGEGGATPSRFKHLIQTADGRFRRLTPRELERLNGFPGDWTAGMSDGKRAFMMGNALVVGVVEQIADSLIADVSEPASVPEHAAAS
jgi:DNA (cytosine-5)-methyltransferase 1